ncbi:MAG: hypothetical protein JRH01_01905 [Deltaproteobacteria bacterium]|nr:hypothetical protein [Deltaproteobacteria bacterium]MBW2394818.1 hypothetical protein [Deltaproteobacteria bacterium]
MGVPEALVSDHAQVLDAHAQAWLRQLSEAGGSLQPGRFRLGLELARQAILRKGKEIIQEHWDVGLFDVVFGSFKAFALYPLLFFAELTWTIPLLEYGPLNTQLWTTGYLFVRSEWLSMLGKRRYGRSLKELFAFRDGLLRMRPRDARSVHRFTLDGTPYTLRIRRGRLLHRWRMFRDGGPEANVMLQRELRSLVTDASFLFRANPLRNNAPLYERLLLAWILTEPLARGRLVARLRPEPGLIGPPARLRDAIGEQGSALAVARVVAAGDALVAALRRRLGSGFSALSLSLRWTHWSYQRHIYHRLAEQERLGLRVLVDWMDGKRPSAFEADLETHESETIAWIGAMETFGKRARAAEGPEAAAVIVDEGIREARERGLTVRLARLARALSPTLRRLRTRPPEPVSAPAWERLGKLEADLEERWSELIVGGFGYTGVRRALVKAAPAATSADLLETANLAQSEFLDRLDDHLRVLHAAHVQEVRARLGQAMHQVWALLGPRRSRSLRREHRRIERLGEQYLEFESLYGTVRDHRRIACFQKFHAGAVAFSARLRSLDPTAPLAPSLSLGDRFAGFGRVLGMAGARSRAGLRGMAHLAAGLRLALSRSGREQRGTPFTRHVDGMFRELGNLLGLRVGVEGREHLQSEVAEGEVEILTPAHRHGVTDNITFAALRLPDYLVFNAVDQLPVFPRFLKNRIASAPGLIAVGGGRGSAVERAVAAVREGRSRRILIYPEGSVSEGLRATRPTRPGFGTGLVEALRTAVGGVRITPITYLDNARFLDLPARSRSEQEQRRRVVVSPSLSADVVERIAEVGGGEALNRMVRLAWLETLVTDEQLWLGTERVTSLRLRLDEELEGASYWGSLESAPVTGPLRPLLGSGVVRATEEACFGRRVRVLRLPDDAKNAGGVIPLEELATPGSLELVLGIRDPAHIYLNVGGQRFDGDIFRPLRVRTKESIYGGLAIRFVGLPSQAVLAIRRELERLAGREYRTFTCAHSACQVIGRAAQVRIDDHGEWRPLVPSHILPTRTLRKLITHGVLDHVGRRVDVEIYKSDDRTVEEILGAMRENEWRIARDHLEMVTQGFSRWLRSLRLRLPGGRK